MSTPTAHDVIAPCEECGLRCDRCNERMCNLHGPEPRACGLTCADCPCACGPCTDAAQDRREQSDFDASREAS